MKQVRDVLKEVTQIPSHGFATGDSRFIRECKQVNGSSTDRFEELDVRQRKGSRETDQSAS